MSTEALADVFVQALNCGTAHRSVTHAQVETLAASHQPVIHVKQGSTHVMLLSTLDCGDAECTDARRRANDAEAAVESMQAAFEQRFDAMTRRMEAQRQAEREEDRQQAQQEAAERAAAAERRIQKQAQQQAVEFQRHVHEIQHRSALATLHAEQRAGAAEREWRRVHDYHAFVVAKGNQRLEALQAQLETVLAAANTERAELTARLDATTARLDAVTARLDATTARLDATTAAANTERAELTAELAELKAQLEATTQDMYNEMADARLYALARYGEAQLALVVGKWIARCKQDASQCRQHAQATLAAAFTDTSALDSAMRGLQRLVDEGITKIVADGGRRPRRRHELRLLRLCRNTSADYVQVKQLALAEMFPDGAVNARNWHQAMAAWSHFGGFRGRMQHPTPFEPDIAKLRACISFARFDREVETQEGRTVSAGGSPARAVMRCCVSLIPEAKIEE